MKEDMSRRKLLIGFLIKALVLFIVYEVLYYQFIQPDETVDILLTGLVLKGAVVILNLVGFEATRVENVIFINEVQSVKVAHGCNGLEMLALYIGFIICFPGKWMYKIIYILMGTVALIFSNMIRDALLAINYNYFQVTFDLNHKYTYSLALYFIIFMIWKHWITNYSIVGKKVNE